MSRFLLTAFVSGFATLSAEIFASRITAPLVGNSLYTWTSIIGVILGGIAIGSYWGGVAADRHPGTKLIGYLLLGSGISIAAIPLLARVAPLIVLWNVAFPVRIFLVSLTLFSAPATLLGAIYPSLLRAFLHHIDDAGKKAGLLSGLNSAGGIAGAFFSGFLFIGSFGTSYTLWGLAFLLILVSLFWQKNWLTLGAAALTILLAVTHAATKRSEHLLFETESPYYTIRVAKGPFGSAPTKLLFLDLDVHSVEGVAGTRVGTYQDIAPILGVFKKEISSAFVIGGGSYNIPKDLVRTYGSTVTVAEIDPQVTKTAQNFFGLDQYPMRIFHGDGRVYLNLLGEKFDLIFNDAFNSFISMPWHLATVETHKAAKNLLTDDGLYAVSIISAAEGENADVYRSTLKTFAGVFPEYHVLKLGDGPEKTQNIILVGMNKKTPISVSEQDLNARARVFGVPLSFVYEYQPPIDPSAPLFSDDYAPMEKALAPLVLSYIKGYAPWYYSIILP